MIVDLRPGKYVLAVSGGVDSVVLLDLLAARPEIELIVAHYDHGIRDDSGVERELVAGLAKAHSLSYVTEQGKLGHAASEAVARTARYAFLEQVRLAHGAAGVVTAHHQDDVLETMVLNMLRGTGRRGLSSLKSTRAIVRPLLHVSKSELLRYATEQGLIWREDSTNSNPKYLRNYIRQNIMPRFASSDREALLAIHQKSHELNLRISEQVTTWLDANLENGALRRHEFTMLPHIVAREVMAEWLLTHTNAQLSKKLLERLVIAAKTGPIGSKFDINKQGWLRIDGVFLALEPRER